MTEDRSNDQPSDESRELEALQRELDQARAQLADLEGLLGDLPQMFERKFEQRLEPLLEQQRLIAEENQLLLDQVRHVLGSGEPPGGRPALPAAGETAPAKAELPPLTPGPAPSPASPRSASPRSVAPSPTSPKPTSASPKPPPAAPAVRSESLGGEQAITVRHWVLPQWLPQGFPLARLRRGAGLLGLSVGVALVVAAAVAGLQGQRSQMTSPVLDADSPASAGPTSAATASSTPSPQVVFRAKEVSWLDVRDAKGSQLYWGLLKGERRFPLGAGLKVLAGRPDLVTVEVAGAPPRVLGRIEQVIAQPIKAP